MEVEDVTDADTVDRVSGMEEMMVDAEASVDGIMSAEVSSSGVIMFLDTSCGTTFVFPRRDGDTGENASAVGATVMEMATRAAAIESLAMLNDDFYY